MTEYQKREKEIIATTWQGDELQTKKTEDHTRVMFHNVNHLSLFGAAGIHAFQAR